MSLLTIGIQLKGEMYTVDLKLVGAHHITLLCNVRCYTKRELTIDNIPHFTIG